jgi:hypothetical protein
MNGGVHLHGDGDGDTGNESSDGCEMRVKVKIPPYPARDISPINLRIPLGPREDSCRRADTGRRNEVLQGQVGVEISPGGSRANLPDRRGIQSSSPGGRRFEIAVLVGYVNRWKLVA